MTRNVLSIQSHVCHGYVGNRAAGFPLQHLGWNFDALNTVLFSNHPGYGKFSGTSLSGEEIEEVYFDGLKKIGIPYDGLITGYVRDESGLRAIGKIGRDVSREQNGELVWLMDPVLGDNGKLYVAESIVPVYKEILAESDVTIVTPNQFEAQLLSGVEITDRNSCEEAIRFLHTQYNIPVVIITSCEWDNHMFCLASDSRDASQGIHKFEIEKYDCGFAGSGDLFAALLMDKYFKYDKSDIASAVRDCLQIIREVLKLSYAEQLALNQASGTSSVSYVYNLALIQSKHLFV